MRNNDLKKLLKSECEKIEIDDLSQDILLKINPNQSDMLVTQAKPPKKKFKILVPTFSTLLAVLIFVVVLLIPFNSNRYDGKDIKPNYNVTEVKTIIGNELLAGTSFLDTNPVPIRGMKSANNLTMDMYLTEAKSIQRYLKIAEMMLNKDNIKIDVFENKDEEFSDYSIKMVVKYSDPDLASDYIFYYNETATVETSDTDDMDEINSKIEGVILLNGNRYQVTGKKEVENDEYETELKIVYNTESYIVIEQETEKNENEFSYTFYEGGKKVKALSQEFNQKENKFSLEAKEYLPKLTEYEMEFLINSDQTISCEYEKEINDLEVELKLTIVKGENYYEYHFKDGSEEVVVKLEI